MSPEVFTDRTPVEPESVQALFLLGQPVNVAEGCVNCPILALQSIQTAKGIVSQGPQLNLFDTHDYGIPDMDRGQKEIVIETYQERAQAGIDGSCPFTQTVDSCWRRQPVALEPDTTDQQ